MGLYMTLVLLFVTGTGSFVAGSDIPSYDTIVVGVGAAGATAAATLAHAGRRVLALEAQGRAGGRVRTERFGDGVVELGAGWIYGLHPSRVYDLAVQNNVSVVLQELSFSVRRADGSGPDPLLTELLQRCAELMDQQSDRIESVGEFIERKLRQYVAEKHPELLNEEEPLRGLLQLANEMVNTLDASNDFHDVTAQSEYTDLDGSKYGSWHRHGYSSFIDILLNTYNNGPGLPSLQVKLNTEVTNIEWGAPGGSPGPVLVTCRDGARYSADNVIVTVSLGVLKERHGTLFSPPLPQEKVAAIEFISMGVLDRIVLSFPVPWPADRSTSVMFYWSAADRESLPEEDRWLARIAGTSPPAGSNDTLTLWIAGDGAKFMETLPEEVVRRKAVELLQRFLGRDVTVPQPTAMLRSTWSSNPFTRGSYSYDNAEAPHRVTARQELAAPLLDAAGAARVLFAGEATTASSFGTVHGASDSGHREARRVLA